MTAVRSAPASLPPPASEGFGPPPPPRRVRNPAGTLLGVLLVVVCACGVAVFTASAGHRKQVLIVTRPVKAGAVLQGADLTETRVSVDASVHVVPAGERSRAVGRVAGVNLVPGTLLSFDDLTTGPRLAPGQAVVGLALKAGQLPSELHALDRVMLVETVGASGGAAPTGSVTPGVAEPSSGIVLVPSAQVYSTGQAPDGQTTTVSVIVPADAAPRVASDSVSDRISVVLVGGDSP